MISEIPPLEFAAAAEGCAADILWEAGIDRPPVDARLVAGQLGLVVAADDRLACRVRFARLMGEFPMRQALGTIVVGPAERPEREQWALAHEIGESVAWRVFQQLGVRPDAAPPDAREQLANQLANRLLLPRPWFESAGRKLDWDLFALKDKFATASHELIARRMLEMSRLIVVTICDLGRVAWRRSNVSRCPPNMLEDEREAWQRTHESGRPVELLPDPSTGLERVRCWPVHEPGWKREIVRSDICTFIASASE